MLSLILFAAVSSAGLPDGSRLAEQDACFVINVTRDGKTAQFGQVRQSVRRASENGHEVIRVLVHQRGLGGFDMRDSFVLDAKTLRPIRFRNERSSAVHVTLDYTDTRVSGSKKEKDGTSTPVDVALSQPVWEGNLFGVTFAALPLAPGGEYRVPSYQYDKGLGEFTVRVKGTQSVDTPDGPVDAWVLDAGADEQQRVEYLVAKDKPRELGYRAGGFSQSLGGDCSTMPPDAGQPAGDAAPSPAAR